MSSRCPSRAPFGLILLQLFACTLGSDFEPALVGPIQGQGAAAPAELPDASLEPPTIPVAPLEPPVPLDAAPTPTCAGSSELPGCELAREELAPTAPAECSSALDCASRHCSGGSCIAASCADGISNQGESSTDCGGPCPARCGAGDTCRSAEDCTSGLSCTQAGRCTSPSCTDGLQNGDESGFDCGGSCAGCAAGAPCGRAEDCATRACREGVCVSASCTDLVHNQDETDTDCGGVCGPCATGRGCALDGDCQSGACQDGSCCGGQELDCTRCVRRLALTIDCSSNGASAETAGACNDFLQCLADNSASCPRRHAPGCSDAGGICDATRFGGISSAAIALADGIIGTAQCNF